MPTADSEQLHALKAQFDALLETRIGELLGQVRAIQELTRRITATEAEIRQNEQLAAPMEEELGTLTTENQGLQSRVNQLRDHVAKMRAMKKELMSNLTTLKNELE